MCRLFTALAFALILAGATGTAISTDARAESTYSVCGYTFVQDDDGRWTVSKDGQELDTYSDEYTLADMVEEYCS